MEDWNYKQFSFPDAPAPPCDNHTQNHTGGEKGVERETKYYQMTEEWIREFIELMYAGRKGKVMVVAIKSHPDKDTIEKIKYPEDLKNADFIRYLRYLNRENYNIYITVNMLKEDALNRRAESFYDKQATLYFDFDSKLIEANKLFKSLYSMISRGMLPDPSYVVKTSKGNYQVYYVFEDGIEFLRLQRIMKIVNEKLRLDPTHDISRVFRIVGFRNKKENKDHLVMPVVNDIRIDREAKINITKTRYSLKDFENIEKAFAKDLSSVIVREVQEINVVDFNVGSSLNSQNLEKLENLYNSFHNDEKYINKYRSPSERDIAFAIRALDLNFKKDDIIAFLISKRGDKRDSRYYATLTVQKAEMYIKSVKNMPEL